MIRRYDCLSLVGEGRKWNILLGWFHFVGDLSKGSGVVIA